MNLEDVQAYRAAKDEKMRNGYDSVVSKDDNLIRNDEDAERLKQRMPLLNRDDNDRIPKLDKSKDYTNAYSENV